jgi:putative flippase GtrA
MMTGVIVNFYIGNAYSFDERTGGEFIERMFKTYDQ